MGWRRPRGEADTAPLVTLHVAGGVAGIREELRVLPPGRAVLVRRRSGRRPRTWSCHLAPGEWAEIERLVDSADLDAAAARAAGMKPPWLSAPDALSVSITVGDRTVASHDAPVVLPPMSESAAGEPPPAPRTEGDPDPLRSLRSALLKVRTSLGD